MRSVFYPRLVNGPWGEALLFHHSPRYAQSPGLLAAEAAAAFAAEDESATVGDVQMHSVFDKSLC